MLDMLYSLQQLRTPLGESIFGAITYIGSDIILLAAICVLLWLCGRRAALRMALSYVVCATANHALKALFAVPRPWVLDSRIIPVENALADATGYSFPSGHSTTAASLMTSLALFVRRRWAGVVCAVLTALVMFSRMYLGVHTLADVCVGAATGAMLTALTTWLILRYEDSRSYYRSIFIGGAALALSVAVYAAWSVAQGAPADSAGGIMTVTGGLLGFVSGLYIDSRYEEARMPLRRSLPLLVVGLAAVVLLRSGLKSILGLLPGSIWHNFIRYALIAAYISCVHPMLMRRAGACMARKAIRQTEV